MDISVDSVDTDVSWPMRQARSDEMGTGTVDSAMQERVQGLINLTRAATGLDVFFASSTYNPLHLKTETIASIHSHLANEPKNWFIKHQQDTGEEFLAGQPWAFASVAASTPSLICFRNPGSTPPQVLSHLCTSLKLAIADHEQLQKQSLAQQLAIEIGRQAQNETLLDTLAPGKSARNFEKMGNVDLDVNIFANATGYVNKVLQGQSCTIFDVSDFRMTHASPQGTRSLTSSSVLSAKHARDSPQMATGSSMSSPSRLSDQSSFMNHSMPTASSRDSLGGRKYCSYVPSETPLRILGHAGACQQHYDTLSGSISKPVVARYLSMTRKTALNSKTFLESRKTAHFGLAALAPPEARTFLCSSVAEADSQPAYLILVCFDQEEVTFDRTEELFLEQIGAYLIYSSIRSRVVAVDRAQMRFTQRIQHELRTPLHAIIGFNEILKQSFMTQSFSFDEINDLIDSIGTSADQLDGLVDDMVSFSLMERLSGERRMMQAERSLSDWSSICSIISATCLQGYQLKQRVALLERKMGHSRAASPPPPEMFITFEDLFSFEWTDYKAQVDIEIVRRILWKLILNAIEATADGIIHVTVARRSARESFENGSSTPSLQVVIADTGRGMEQKFVDERLFRPFGKEDEESGGVGLSLSICQHLVAQLSGRLTATSRIGVGTSMTVSLPLKKAEGDSRVKARPPKYGPLLAFIGFDSRSKRLFVEKLLEQFHVGEEKNLEKAAIVIVCADDSRLQLDYNKEIDVLRQRAVRPEIIVMPASFLHYDLEEDRPAGQEALELALGQEIRIIPRPMGLSDIQLMSRLLAQQAGTGGIAASAGSMPAILSETNERLSALPQKQGLGLSPGATEVQSAKSVNEDDLERAFSVLVVEDNPLNARIMTTMLKKAGIEHHLANDGKMGVEAFSKHLPALVLLDINMPVMNGFEACQEMRRIASPYAHKIIAITALSTEAEKRKGLECGMDAWLTKPTRIIPLIREIKRWRRQLDGVAGSDPSTPSSHSGSGGAASYNLANTAYIG